MWNTVRVTAQSLLYQKSRKPAVYAAAISMKTNLANCNSVSLCLKVLFFCILAMTVYSSRFLAVDPLLDTYSDFTVR
jgi:hypothetical protein